MTNIVGLDNILDQVQGYYYHLRIADRVIFDRYCGKGFSYILSMECILGAVACFPQAYAPHAARPPPDLQRRTPNAQESRFSQAEILVLGWGVLGVSCVQGHL